MLIAHSLPHPFFGPAQNKHGATYVVDAEFRTSALDEHNVVIDIGLAHQILRDALAPLNYQDLDDLPEFAGQLTTTEFLARHIHAAVCQAVPATFNGVVKVTLGESHVAWAAYEGPVR